MRRTWARIGAVAAICGVVSGVWGPTFDVSAARGFASPIFESEWQAGERRAANFWGPLANASEGVVEEYKEGSLDYSEGGPTNPGQGTRLVQYFDKGRMEITAPARGDVTNGLLTVELMTGRMQLGNDSFLGRGPVRIPAVGDPDNPFPMYADLGRYLTTPQAVDNLGTGIVSTQLMPDGTLSTVLFSVGDPLTRETVADLNRFRVPRAFAEFRDRVGLSTVGYAVTRPAYVTAKVGGQMRQVLVQGFERRVLTYTPSNPAAFRVEFGNIGQHYQKWRYPNGTPTAGSANALPTAPYARFAKQWDAHGFTLRVRADGSATASWRTYAMCGDDPPPCDTFSGNEIINGGNATIRFMQANGDTTDGTVTTSTAPDLLARGPVTLALQPYDTAVLWWNNGSRSLTLCGPRFAELAPRSVFESRPCGA